jgi:PAS domain S-box-containing protein
MGNFSLISGVPYLLQVAAVVVFLSITIILVLLAKRSQAERDQAREEWEKTFEAVTDPIMIINKDFSIARANKAMASWLGVSRNEAVGLKCHQRVHQCNEPIAGCPHKLLLEDGTAHSAEIYDKESGRHFYIAVYPIFDSDGFLTSSIHYAKDITADKQSAKELRRAESNYRIIANNTHAWEFWIDPDGSYIYTSPSCERITGYLPEEFTADPGLFLRIVHPEDRERLLSHQHTLAETGAADTEEIVFRVIRRDGAMRWLAHDCRPIYSSGGKYLGIRGSNSDITDRKNSEIEIQRQLKNMTALTDIGMAISSTLDVRVTLNILLERLISQLAIDAATVLLLDQESLYLRCAASLGFRTDSILNTCVRIGKGHAGRAAFERRIQIIPDLSDTLTHSLKEERFHGYVAVPLIAQGKVVGVLELFHRNVINPSHEWLAFLELMASQAAIAIDNASMFFNLQKTNTELMLSYDATLEGWGRTLEFRDEDTMGHTERVTSMTVQLARLIGLDEREIVHLRRGAMLHDIGKISIPDTILLKPGPLTPEEQLVMQRHTVYAYELLKPIPFLRAALDIPYCHHEKWDGTGTPRGLKGEDIPLNARIFSVVDAWDALRSDRPYRKAWPYKEVKEYIQQRSSADFDPKVVEVFLQYLDNVKSDGPWANTEFRD